MILLVTLLSPNTYLWLVTLFLVGMSVILALRWRRMRRRGQRWCWLLLLLLVWGFFFYGTFVGVTRLTVRHVEFASNDLPAAFDGYRIVQFSDAHVPSLTGWRADLLRRAVDSIMAQHADMIVFTGDMQNREPKEIPPHLPVLSRLKAKDGVCAVLGNHDYAMYLDCSDEQKYINKGETVSQELSMDWHVLLNNHRTIRRGQDSIVIAGMENDGQGRFPQLGNVNSALMGVSRRAFVIMLEHDPTAWRRKILPHSHCQLTLSGHTHGGQMSLLGMTPASLHYREIGGMYYAGQRAMYVSTGLSGVIPFRFGVPPEIVVITLHKK